MGFIKVMLGTHVGYMWSVNIQILNMYGIYLGYKYICGYVYGIHEVWGFPTSVI